MIDEVIKYHQEQQIKSIVQISIFCNDIKPIKKLLTNNYYKQLTQDEKELETFKTIYAEFLGKYDVTPFLQYIIFDYNISEANSIANINNLKPEVKNMFALRDLNKGLNIELLSNSDKLNNRIKI